MYNHYLDSTMTKIFAMAAAAGAVVVVVVTVLVLHLLLLPPPLSSFSFSSAFSLLKYFKANLGIVLFHPHTLHFAAQ